VSDSEGVPLVLRELARQRQAGPTGPTGPPINVSGLNGPTGPANSSFKEPTGPTGPAIAPSAFRGIAAEGRAGSLSGDAAPGTGEGHAGGRATSAAAGGAVHEAVGSTNLRAEGGTFAVIGARAEMTVTPRSPDAVGRVVIANRDSVIVQARTIELLLSGAIERAKETRSNSESLPDLEAIHGAAIDLLQSLLSSTTLTEGNAGTNALSFKDGLVRWWSKDHASILDRSYNAGLFTAGLLLCATFGLIPAVTIATLIKGKEMKEVLESCVEVLKRLGVGDH
jgi:hypothetical protein